jgi:hypothetical protein
LTKSLHPGTDSLSKRWKQNKPSLQSASDVQSPSHSDNRDVESKTRAKAGSWDLSSMAASMKVPLMESTGKDVSVAARVDEDISDGPEVGSSFHAASSIPDSVTCCVAATALSLVSVVGFVSKAVTVLLMQ